MTQNNEKRIRFFDKFPTKSNLNSSDQLKCIRAITNINSKIKDVSKKMDEIIYYSLTNIRLKEEEIFQSFVKSYFLTNLSERYENLDSSFEEFVVNKWKKYLEFVKGLKNNFFSIQTALELDYSSGSEVKCEFQKIFDGKGIIPRIILVLKKPFSENIKQTTTKMEKMFDFHEQSDFFSNDLIALKIALESECDFVITTESICCFLNNFSESWNILVNIKNIAEDNKNIIFINNPLPKTFLSGIDRIRESFDFGLKAKITFPTNNSSYISGINKSVKADKIFKENIVNEEMNDSSEDDLIIDEVVEEKTEVVEEPVTEELPEELPKKIEYKVVEFDEYLKNKKTTTKMEDETGRNYSYRLWKLSENDLDIKLLVRTNQDGCDKDEDGNYKFVNLSTKVEFKSEFGAEKMSREELIREWCNLYFRPGTVTQRVRIDAPSSIIMSQTLLDLSKIEEDLDRLHKVKPQELLQKLFGIFRIMKNLPHGNFLMRHESKDLNKVKIYRETSEKSQNSLNLQSVFADVNFSKTQIGNESEYNEIDPMEVTSVHRHSSVMPCAFVNWGKNVKKNTVINDRAGILERHRNQKDEQIKNKKKRADFVDQMRRKNKNKKKHDKRRLLRGSVKPVSADSKSTPIGDTIDPYEVFDERGNFNFNTVSSPKVSKIERVEQKTPESSTASIDFNEYLKAAKIDVKELNLTENEVKNNLRRSVRNKLDSPVLVKDYFSPKVSDDVKSIDVSPKVVGFKKSSPSKASTSKKLSTIRRLRNKCKLPVLTTKYF